MEKFTRGIEFVGVSYLSGNVPHVIHARLQVFLSAGVVRTPQILQLNGIGPSALLEQFSIPVNANNVGVGANLAAHKAISLEYFDVYVTVPGHHCLDTPFFVSWFCYYQHPTCNPRLSQHSKYQLVHTAFD